MPDQWAGGESGGGGELGGGLCLQVGDRAAQDPRHVHLRAPDPRADLRLRQVLLEAQAQHLPLVLREQRSQPGDGRGVLGRGEAGILDAQFTGRALVAVGVLARALQ